MEAVISHLRRSFLDSREQHLFPSGAFWCLRRYFGKAIHGLYDTATEFWRRQFCYRPLMIVISELNYSAGKVAGAYWIYGHIHAFSAGDYIDGYPIMLVLAYKLRSCKTARIIAIMCLFGIQFLSYSRTTGTVNFSYRLSCFMAFLISMIFMGVKKYFRISPQKRYRQ